MGKQLRPWLQIGSLARLDLDRLRQCDIKGIAFDVDNTLTVHHGKQLHESIKTIYYQSIEQFNCLIFSNCGRKRHQELKKIFHIPVMPLGYKKPSKKSFKLASQLLGLPPEQIVMVGDRVLTDVLGGNRSGFKTILTKPLSHIEPRSIRFIRYLEMLRFRSIGY